MIESLATLQDAISSAWGADTCDPRDLADWHPGNPARGQCGVTALVIGSDQSLMRQGASGAYSAFHQALENLL